MNRENIRTVHTVFFWQISQELSYLKKRLVIKKRIK